MAVTTFSLLDSQDLGLHIYKNPQTWYPTRSRFLLSHYYDFGGFPCGLDSKVSACHVGELGSTPGSGRFPGEGNGNPLQYSCLKNPMDGGAW